MEGYFEILRNNAFSHASINRAKRSNTNWNCNGFESNRCIFLPLVKKVDSKIESGMKRLKSISILGIILFVGIPLPTTGTWTAAAIASILKMRIKTSLLGVLIGNMMSGIIVSLISLHII